MIRIEDIIGQTKSADGIKEEVWFPQVMKELDEISKNIANELQTERKDEWNKGTYKQEFYEAPPMRLLSLALPLISWLGWMLHEKNLIDGQNVIPLSDIHWKTLEHAFNFGVNHSKNNPGKSLREAASNGTVRSYGA